MNALFPKLLSLTQELGLREKKWQFITVAHPQYLVAMGIVDLKFGGHVFLSCVDLKTREQLVNFSAMAVPGVQLKVKSEPNDGAMASWHSFGQSFVQSLSLPGLMESQKSHMKFSGIGEGYEIDVSLPEFAFELKSRLLPAVPVTPALEVKADVTSELFGKTLEGKVHTQKKNLLHVEGEMKLNGRPVDLSNAFAGIDYTCGLFPRVTRWHWGFALGQVGVTQVGFNLSIGNNIGDANENALWWQGQLIPLKSARFDFNPCETHAPWRVKTEDGAIDVVFHPFGVHNERQRFGLVESDFLQISGAYSGVLKNPQTGETLAIEELPGFAEDQNVKW